MSAEATVVKKARVPGAERKTITEVKLDNSYKTGGLSLTPAQLGLKRVEVGFGLLKNGSEAEATSVAAVATYDVANQKILVNDYKTQKEIAEGKDLSKVVFLVHAWGV